MLAGCAFVGWNGNLLRVPSSCVGVGRRTDLAPSLTSGRPPFLLGRWGALPARRFLFGPVVTSSVQPWCRNAAESQLFSAGCAAEPELRAWPRPIALLSGGGRAGALSLPWAEGVLAANPLTSPGWNLLSQCEVTIRAHIGHSCVKTVALFRSSPGGGPSPAATVPLGLWLAHELEVHRGAGRLGDGVQTVLLLKW